MQITLRVKDMDCVEEVTALRQTVGKVPGVGSLDFNLLKGTMTVTLTDDTLREDVLLDAVKRAGLHAVPVAAASTPPHELAVETFWQRRGRGILCWASGLLLTAGYLSHAWLHGGFLDALGWSAAAVGHRLPPLSIGFYVAAVLAGGWFVLPKAVAAARRLLPDMNLLMTIAVVGAMFIGEWLEAATVTFLFALSLLLESWSVNRARQAVAALLDLAPPTARLRDAASGEIVERPIVEVSVGATVLVRPGERIPVDGVIRKGSTGVDQAPITGESVPVQKEAGDEVFAATINETGAIEIEVTRPAADTTLARIIHMVEAAQSRRAPSEQWVTAFARVYTPLMVGLAALVALVPPLLFHGAWATWFYESLVMLVIACPCALVISTPVSIVAALTSAARAGVLIKGGVFLEAAAGVKVVAIDKTGTITEGHPEVQQVVPLDEHTAAELLERAAALEAHSDHPLARAILRRAQAAGVKVAHAEGFRLIKGKGAEGRVFGRRFWIGNHRLMDEMGSETEVSHNQAEAMEDAGHSVVAVGNEQHVCGLISVADTIRRQAPAAVRALKAAGVRKIVMLTGDNEGTARAVARAVDVTEVRAELLPEDKLLAVEELVTRFGPTAMIGDGVNDAPALAVATLGIAMGAAGTDAAIETADVALMSDDLMRVPWLIRHAQRALRIVRQNIGFALGVKAVFMALAVAQVATLWMAIAADTGASLVVIFNALRLLHGHADVVTHAEVEAKLTTAGRSWSGTPRPGT